MLFKIFSQKGTPSFLSQELPHLEDYGYIDKAFMMRFPDFKARSLTDCYPPIHGGSRVPADLVAIMDQMTEVNPLKRMTPQGALRVLDAYKKLMS